MNSLECHVKNFLVLLCVKFSHIHPEKYATSLVAFQPRVPSSNDSELYFCEPENNLVLISVWVKI